MLDKYLQPKIKEILIKSKDLKEKGVFCETFVYQPENIEEMKLGSLFFVGRIQGAADPSHLINLLTSTIKREYYTNSSRKPLTSLEAGLKKANATLADLAKTGKIDWLDKISFICVALAKDYLHLTQVGQTKILLLRSGRLSDISRKLVPLQDKVHPQKMFQSVASGKIYEDDKIILTTADIFKYIPLKGLKQILEQGKINQLEQLLNERKDFSSQGLIVIEITTEEKPLPAAFREAITLAPATTVPVVKINRLALLRDKSREIFAEINFVSRSFLFKTKDRFKLLQNKLKLLKEDFLTPKVEPKVQQRRLPSEVSTPATPKTETPVFKKPIAIQDIKLQESIVDKAADKAKTLPVETQLNEKPKAPVQTLKKSLQTLWQKLTSFLFSLWQKIRQLYLPTTPQRFKVSKDRKSAISFGKLTILLFLLIIAALTTRHYYLKKYQSETTYYNNLSEQALEKILQINKITTIDNLEVFADFSQAENGFSPDQILIAKNNLLSLSSQSSLINLTPLLEGAAVGKFVSSKIPADKNWLKALIFDDENSIIFLDQANSLFRYNFADDEFLNLSPKLPFSSIQIKDIRTYFNAFYLLDVLNNQIIKCPRLGNCQIWLKEKTDFSSALSLAIDGSIYVIFDSGDITRYYGGYQKEILRTNIRPPLSKSSQLYTKLDFKNLYILDPEQGRIIVIDKQGQLIKQMVHQDFSELKDLEIIDDEKILFVLSGKKIYRIDLAE